MTNAGPPRPAQPARRGGGIVRIVLGIVILVFAVLGSLGNLASGRMVASGGAAETFGAVLGRLIIIAIGVALLVSGLRARRRRAG